MCAGLRVVDPSLAADSLVTGASPLTEREAQVLREAASGGTAQQIARRCFCRLVRCVITCRRRWRRRGARPSGCGAYRHGERLALAPALINTGGSLREHGRMVVSMPAGAPAPVSS